MIGDLVGDQPPVQPKGLATGPVTAHDRRIGRQPEANLRASDFLQDPIRRPDRNLPDARPLPRPVVKPSFHVRSPSSKASNNVVGAEVTAAVDSCVRVMVIIVTLL
jgi:hypothetical protein